MAAGSEEELLQRFEDEDDLEYYTLLNLDRNATQEEVCVAIYGTWTGTYNYDNATCIILQQ